MRHKETIDKITNFLKSQNHEIVYEWSKLDSLKPYNENSNRTSSIANEISLSLKNVDIFVLITDEAGTDMFIELGIVIGRWLDNNKIKIYAVGKFNDRSLMHFHPAIKRVNKLSDIFSKECPELLNQSDAAFLTSLSDEFIF
jgi:hypothetical protein